MFVRWENLTIDADERARLPGYREAAVVRHFDAPEALDIRFYEVRAKSALNRVPERSQMPFRWTINPYRGCTHACRYCFARPTHTYLGMDAGRDFEREIVVKVNVPEVLRRELARPSWQGEHVAMGTNTDPYQWVEGRYKLMPGIWEALRDAANPCSVLTKSPLLLRDLPLLQQVAERAPVSANLSVPTLDEKAWRASEPHTPHPRARLEAVAELNRAGIPTGILVAPLMPGINDAPEQVERILELAGEAGATSIGGHRPAPARRGARDLLRVAALLPARPRGALRGALSPRCLCTARGAPAPVGAAAPRPGPRPAVVARDVRDARRGGRRDRRAAARPRRRARCGSRRRRRHGAAGTAQTTLF